MRELDDAPRIGERADGVRREREGDHARPVGELPLEIVEVHGRVVVQLDEADLQVEVVRELEPRRDVPVVVEPRDEDLVAGAQRPAERSREHEVQRRHVLAEDRLAGLAAQERRGGEVRLGQQRVAAAARGEGAAEVRIRLAQIAGDRLDHRVGALRASRPVEERGRRLEAR